MPETLYQKEYRKTHPDKEKEKCEKWRKNHPNYMRDYIHKLRMKCLIHYGGDPPKCACCEESNIFFLTIDHINNNGAEHRKKIGWSRLYYWLVENDFPDGFQVLCYNCNCGKARNNGVCPHIKIVKNYHNV